MRIIKKDTCPLITPTSKGKLTYDIAHDDQLQAYHIRITFGCIRCLAKAAVPEVEPRCKGLETRIGPEACPGQGFFLTLAIPIPSRGSHTVKSGPPSRPRPSPLECQSSRSPSSPLSERRRCRQVSASGSRLFLAVIFRDFRDSA